MASELDDLNADNLRRLTVLAGQGIQVNGLVEGYHTRLLEDLVGDRLYYVKLEHERWVAEQLDHIEENQRKAKLLQGINHTNGKG